MSSSLCSSPLNCFLLEEMSRRSSLNCNSRVGSSCEEHQIDKQCLLQHQDILDFCLISQQMAVKFADGKVYNSIQYTAQGKFLQVQSQGHVRIFALWKYCATWIIIISAMDYLHDEISSNPKVHVSINHLLVCLDLPNLWQLRVTGLAVPQMLQKSSRH